MKRNCSTSCTCSMKKPVKMSAGKKGGKKMMSNGGLYGKSPDMPMKGMKGGMKPKKK